MGSATFNFRFSVDQNNAGNRRAFEDWVCLIWMSLDTTILSFVSYDTLQDSAFSLLEDMLVDSWSVLLTIRAPWFAFVFSASHVDDEVSLSLRTEFIILCDESSWIIFELDNSGHIFFYFFN